MTQKPRIRTVFSLVLALAFLGVAGCSDGLFFPGADPGPAGVHVLLPSMADLATGADSGVEGAFARVDRIQATVTPEGSTVPIASELVEVGSASSEIRISLPVAIEGRELPVLVQLELRAGTLPLFRAESRIVLRRGENPSLELTPSPVPGTIVVGTAPPPFASIGDTAPVTASVSFATGEPISELAVTWSSRDPRVAAVSPGGNVTAVGPGSAILEARYGDLVGELEVSVQLRAVSLSIDPSPVLLIEGDALSVSLTARDARNNPFPPAGQTWTSSDIAVASVDSSGNVTGLFPGEATLRARVGTVEAEAPVRVRARVAEIVVTAPITEIGLLEQVSLSAAVTDIRGGSVSPPGVTWTTSDPSVAIVSTTGRVQGQGPGSAEVTAERDGVSGSITITVVRRPASIEVSPPSAVLGPEETLTFSATVLDGLGASFPDAEVTWSSSNPGVVTINPSTGLAQTVGTGVAQIIAESEGITGSAAVTVGVSPPELFGMRGDLEGGAPAGSVWGYFEAYVEPRGVPGFVRFTLLDVPGIPSVLLREEAFPGTDSFEYVETPSINLGDLVPLPGEYTLRAQAFNALGSSMAIDSSFVVLPPPVAGGATYVGEPDPGIRVTWSYPLGSGPDVYFDVQFLDDEFWFSIGSSSTLEFIDPEFGPEGTWFYRVRACASETSTCSPFSGVVTYEGTAPAFGRVRQ